MNQEPNSLVTTVTTHTHVTSQQLPRPFLEGQTTPRSPTVPRRATYAVAPNAPSDGTTTKKSHVHWLSPKNMYFFLI